MTQRHGADVYSADGSRQKLLDFSSTVAELEPPSGWKAGLSRALGGLRHYPQPYSAGLCSALEKELGLPAGSVLVGSGSSECMEWIAQSLKGAKVLLEAPCFGEYALLLSRHGARLRELGADEPWAPEWARLRPALVGAASFWIASPSNPSGLVMGPGEFEEQLAYCRGRGILMVLDEALQAQALEPVGDKYLRLAVAKPGCLVLRSLSKGLALPGLRLGFVAGHPREVAKLGRFLNPWSVSSLAQDCGLWLVRQERRLAAARRKVLAARKLDLLARLERLPRHGIMPRISDTGFFLARLLGRLDDSRVLAARLRAKGMLIRSCASYGGWGLGHIRLNPRSPAENARLARGLREALA